MFSSIKCQLWSGCVDKKFEVKSVGFNVTQTYLTFSFKHNEALCVHFIAWRPNNLQ